MKWWNDKYVKVEEAAEVFVRESSECIDGRRVFELKFRLIPKVGFLQERMRCHRWLRLC